MALLHTSPQELRNHQSRLSRYNIEGLKIETLMFLQTIQYPNYFEKSKNISLKKHSLQFDTYAKTTVLMALTTFCTESIVEVEPVCGIVKQCQQYFCPTNTGLHFSSNAINNTCDYSQHHVMTMTWHHIWLWFCTIVLPHSTSSR